MTASILVLVCLVFCLLATGCQKASQWDGSVAGYAYEEGISVTRDLLGQMPTIATEKDVMMDYAASDDEEGARAAGDALGEGEGNAPDDAADVNSSQERPPASETQVAGQTASEPQGTPDYSNAEYEEDVVLVSPIEGAGKEDIAAVLGVDAGDIEETPAGLLEVPLPSGTRVEDAVATLQDSGLSESAQPNFIYYLQDIQGSLEPQGEFGSVSSTPSGATDAEPAASTVTQDNEETADSRDTPLESPQMDDGSTFAEEPEPEDEGADGLHQSEPASETVSPLPASNNADAASSSSEGKTVSPTGHGDEPSGNASGLETGAGDNLATAAGRPLGDNQEEATQPDDEDAASRVAEPQESDSAVQAPRKPNDPEISRQWALDSVHAFDAWEIMEEPVSSTGPTVAIALFDEGFEMSHPDLAANFIEDGEGGYLSYNAMNESDDMREISSLAGHGTHVAGIVSAVSDNGEGVAGVSNNQKILPVKVFDANARSSTSALVNAYAYVMAHAKESNIRVVNLSVGSIGSKTDVSADSQLGKAIDAAYQAGIVTVASAGNAANGVTLPASNYPSDYSTVVSVINLAENAASDDGVSRHSTSNYNRASERAKNISAPGTDIYSTYPGATYRNKTGTSMAAPCVAGVFAMVFAVNPRLTAQEAVDVVYGTARDLGDEGFDAETGWGEVDAAAALGKALETEGAYDDSSTGSSSTSSAGHASSSTSPSQSAESGKSGSSASSSANTSTSSGKAGADAPSASGKGKAAISIKKATIKPIGAYYRTGEPITPAPRVSYRGKTLALGTDYTVSYKANKKVGTAKVLVKGKGAYTGTATATFRIIARPVYSAGASRMPLQSSSKWSLSHCTLKVVSGKGVVSVGRGGVVKARKKGAAKIAIVDEAGRTVKVRTVKVYRLSGVYTIHSAKNAKLVLDVRGSGQSSGAELIAWKKNKGSTKNQQFKFLVNGSRYQIRAVHSGKFLSVRKSSKKTGAAVVQYKKASKASQKWKITVDGKNRLSFINAKSGKALVVKEPAARGVRIVQQAATGAPSEKWILRKV